MPQSRNAATALVLAACCASCFERPVDERLALHFRGDGRVEIGVTVELVDAKGQTAAVRERVAALRQAFLEGKDDWSRRFDALGADSERRSWEKRRGKLRRFEHSALFEEAGDALSHFFSDTSVLVFHAVDGERAELVLTPEIPSRADRKQRERVRRHLETHAAAIAAYLDATAELWDYLGHHPERARPCLGALFGDALDDGVGATVEPTEEIEDALLERLTAAMTAVAAVLEPEEDEAYSLDELSRLVFDPFPAEIRVSVDGEVEEVAGFVAGEEGALRIRPLGFWDAFVSLEGRWLAPDPLVAYVDATIADRPLDLDEFLTRGRRVEGLPSAAVVEEALVDGLRPAVEYRVVWRPSRPAD